MKEKILVATTKTIIRFSEVDSMGVVWHGNYIKYLEDGREAFGDKYGLDYLTVYKNNYFTPLVNINCNYKQILRYGDTAIIKTKYIDCNAAKLKFEYEIFRGSDNELVTTAESVQVYVNLKGELILTLPPFIVEWKRKMGLI